MKIDYDLLTDDTISAEWGKAFNLSYFSLRFFLAACNIAVFVSGIPFQLFIIKDIRTVVIH